MKEEAPANTHLIVGRVLKARFSGGVLEPLEPLTLEEGEEVTVTVATSKAIMSPDWLERSAGTWAGLVDADKLIRDTYEGRLPFTADR